VTTFGEDEDDALQRAADAVEEALAARIADRKDIPAPSPARGRPVAALPALTVAKVELYRTARAQGITKAELGRRLQNAVGAIELIGAERGKSIRLGISAGIAVFPEDGEDARALIAVSDEQMYADKARRRTAAVA